MGTVFVTVPQNCRKNKLGSTQVALHCRGPHHVNIYCSGGGGGGSFLFLLVEALRVGCS